MWLRLNLKQNSSSSRAWYLMAVAYSMATFSTVIPCRIILSHRRFNCGTPVISVFQTAEKGWQWPRVFYFLLPIYT